jgi:hypothetical protein
MNTNTSLLNHLIISNRSQTNQTWKWFWGTAWYIFVLWNTGNLTSQATTSGYLGLQLWTCIKLKTFGKAQIHLEKHVRERYSSITRGGCWSRSYCLGHAVGELLIRHHVSHHLCLQFRSASSSLATSLRSPLAARPAHPRSRWHIGALPPPSPILLPPMMTTPPPSSLDNPTPLTRHRCHCLPLHHAPSPPSPLDRPIAGLARNGHAPLRYCFLPFLRWAVT